MNVLDHLEKHVEKYEKLVKFVKGCVKHSCCLCNDCCLACDAKKLLEEIGEA